MSDKRGLKVCATCGEESYFRMSMYGPQYYEGCGHDDQGICRHDGPAEFVPANDLTAEENLIAGTPQRCLTCGHDIHIYLPKTSTGHYDVRVDSVGMWIAGCECGAFEVLDLPTASKLYKALGDYIMGANK